MQNTYTWQQERQMLTDAFARRMLVEHNLKEVTTQRQAKLAKEPGEGKAGEPELRAPRPGNPSHRDHNSFAKKEIRVQMEPMEAKLV